MISHPVQTNFTGGEVSPLMMGRPDTAKFKNGASLLRNMIVRPQGGVCRRPGTKFVNQTKFPTKQSILIPFEFSDEQAYVLEFGEEYIHIYKDGHKLMESTTTEVESFVTVDSSGDMVLSVSSPTTDLPEWLATGSSIGDSGRIRLTFSVPHTLRTGQLVQVTSTAWAAAVGVWTINRISPYSVDLVGSTWVPSALGTTKMHSHGLMDGDVFYVSGATNYPTLTEQWHIVQTVVSVSSWQVANVPYVNNGSPTGEEAWTIPIEIVTPYLETDLSQLRFTQTADVLYICHPDYPVKKLQRLDTDGDQNDWLLSDVEFVDGPYLPLNDVGIVNATTPQDGSRYFDVYLEITNYAHTATVKAAANFTDATDDDGSHYLEYRDRDQWRLALIQSGSISGAALTTATVSILDNVLLYLDETARLTNKASKTTSLPGSSANSVVYYKYRGNNIDAIRSVDWSRRLDPNNAIDGTSAAGTLTSQFSNTFGVADVGKFIRYVTTATPPVAYWAEIDGISNTTGTKVHHKASVALATNQSTGKFILTNETRTATVKAYRNSATFALFASTDVGRLVRIGFGGRWTWGTITAFTSTSEVTVTFVEDLPRDPHNALNIAGNQDESVPNSGISYDWKLGTWSGTTGYPRTVCFHEQRLVFGGSAIQPQTLWFSRPGDFENFSPTELDQSVLDDNAITYILVSKKVNPIRWLSSGAVLLVGGLGAEWQVRASSSIQEPITPTNISVTPQTYCGSVSTALPQEVGATVLFADRLGRKIRELIYNFEIDKHVSIDISIISEHLFRASPALVTEYQKDPHNIYWVILQDGTLVGLTYERDNEVAAWHVQELGGSGIAESIAVIPDTENAHDVPYLVVKRTVNGATLRTIEYLQPMVYGSSSSDLTTMRYADCMVEVDAAARTAIEGLHHLEGVSVYALGDGVEMGPYTVTSGSITLDTASAKTLVGYDVVSEVGTMPPDGGVILGPSAQTKTQRAHKAGIRLYCSKTFEFSGDGITYEEQSLEGDFFTGDQTLSIQQGYTTQGVIYIRQMGYAPLNILLVAPELGVYEES